LQLSKSPRLRLCSGWTDLIAPVSKKRSALGEINAHDRRYNETIKIQAGRDASGN